MAEQTTICKNCGESHSPETLCMVNGKFQHRNVAAKAKAVLGRIRALEVKAQSYENQRSGTTLQGQSVSPA